MSFEGTVLALLSCFKKKTSFDAQRFVLSHLVQRCFQEKLFFRKLQSFVVFHVSGAQKKYPMVHSCVKPEIYLSLRSLPAMGGQCRLQGRWLETCIRTSTTPMATQSNRAGTARNVTEKANGKLDFWILISSASWTLESSYVLFGTVWSFRFWGIFLAVYDLRYSMEIQIWGLAWEKMRWHHQTSSPICEELLLSSLSYFISCAAQSMKQSYVLIWLFARTCKEQITN